MSHSMTKCARALVVIASILLSSLRWSSAAGTPVVINEIMADNRSAVACGAHFPDWVEVHNPTLQALNIGGCSLTDDPLLPRQFVFPETATIPALGHLVVWCSTNTAIEGLRAPFGLGSKSDRLLLYARDGITLLDHIDYGLQPADLSLGRLPDGTGDWTLNEPTPEGPNSQQPLGQPATLRFNEWLAMPGTGQDDWLELYNGASQPVELTGLIVTDRVFGTPTNRPIPALSFIAAHGFVQLFASDLNEKDADHLDFKLSSSGEVLTLYAADRATMLDRVAFGQQTSLRSEGRAPDGGPTIVTFAPGAVTPGAANFAKLADVVVSEVLSHTDPPLEDAIELQNPGSQPVDISYWWLSDAASDLKKYQFPSGSILPPHGFLVVYAFQFGVGPRGFNLDSAEGDEVFLSAGDAGGALNGQQTSVKFGALKNGVSVGRHVTSTGVEFVPLSQRTFGADNPGSLPQFRTGTGATNAAPRVGPVVIHEILYRSPAATGIEVESLELHNPGPQAVPLYDLLHPANTWRLRNGITFRFPEGVTLPAGGYLLLVNFDPAADPAAAAAFRLAFGVPAEVPLHGPFEGHLSDTGEPIEMLWPDNPQGPDSANPGYVPYEQIERVVYATRFPWPAPAGDAQSLQRRDALAFGNDPQNWVAAMPSLGRPNTVDADADGMPDAWEAAHRLNPASASDAAMDSDGDGASNLGEYLMGTDPTRPESVFRVQFHNPGAGSGILEFEGLPGRSYSLQSCRSLGEPWHTLTNYVVGSAATIQHPVSSGVDAARFFRIVGYQNP